MAHWHKIRIDKNDTLYSKIIRFGKTRCERCQKVRELQCAHIIGRVHHASRFVLDPKPNAVSLCATCHSWFDTHKMDALIMSPEKRVFTAIEEGYTFIIKTLGYTWSDLQLLYAKSRAIIQYHLVKDNITEQLKERLRALESGEI